MGIFDGYFDNFINFGGPKGNLGDYQHAARLYVDNNMRLAPKFKHLYHIVFNIESEVQQLMSPLFGGVDKKEINILAKSADLPKFNIDTQTVNQYNRKKIVQTKVNYQPINIAFHDDNAGLTTLFWETYFRYYFTDPNYVEKDAAGNPGGVHAPFAKAPGGLNNAYGNSTVVANKFGLDRFGKKQNFFKDIQIFQFSPQNGKSSYTAFTLINPYITGLQHDRVDQGAGELTETSMTIEYEAVTYARGYTVPGSSPTGFAETHYDKIPSPLSNRNAVTLFGRQGILAGVDNIISDFKNGNILSSIVKTNNLITNASQITPTQLQSELGSIVGGVTGQALNNTVFPSLASNSPRSVAAPKSF
jgi:hypothetical protein